MNSEMKGIEKKRMWVALGKRKNREREREIPPGSEPVGLNNGSA